ncbi:DNA topoisomerase IV, alpha subunit [Tothia fuscella]|uniref:DNA topoisomerase (ATP-hydrolyzing) n=1 Tax=Tothia fuscella TaxID=1048955 RepID=A0A9P4NHM8_9PEZI|nr:DNA topoisomerase IV, alpha subunit [Tothia fuscella]
MLPYEQNENSLDLRAFRDIYYRDPNLFSKQSVVDRFVDDLACTFDVPRSLLNVTATAKGLVAGAFTITRPDGTSMNGLGERDGTLISRLHGDETVDMAQVRWILIVEKEATINCLITNAHFYDNYLTQGIIITAKGYPDLSTRSLLSLLTTQTPSPPLSILVDYDPDGLSILSTYKYGSTSTSHENLTLPSIRWLGVNSSYIGKQDSLHQSQGLLRLSGRDRRLAARMLEKQLFGEDGPEQEWRVEVQRMLMLNVKAEIQVLEAGPGGLVGWMKGSGLFD